MRKLALLLSVLFALSGFSAAVAAAPAADAATAGDSYGDEWFDDEAQMEADEAVPAPPADAVPQASAAPAGVDGGDADPRALEDFRPALDPYGYWIDDPKYGRVWVPNRSAVGDDFAPYVTSGHWALDVDSNWVWVSDYPFGWVVFHYGRWVWIGSVGWTWVPGYRYAPAWVTWRVPTAGYAYVGWAPLPPTFVWFYGSAFAVWFYTPYPFVFVSSGFVFRHHLHRHIIRDRRRIRRIAGLTRRYRPARASAALRGPSLDAARVPPSRRPVERIAAAPRATGSERALMYRSTPSPGTRLGRSRAGVDRGVVLGPSGRRVDGGSVRMVPSRQGANRPRRSGSNGRRAIPDSRLERGPAPPATRRRPSPGVPPQRAAPRKQYQRRLFDQRSGNQGTTLRRTPSTRPSARSSGGSSRPTRRR